MSSSRSMLLTGASSGIGHALAKELAKRGHQLWLGARRADRLEALVSEIASAGGKAVAVSLDVSDHAACAKAIEALDDEHPFDTVIANAGVGGGHTSVWKTTVDAAKDCIDTNFTGALATILPLLPRMRARGGGHVVGVSSMAATMTQPMAAVYGATKAALTFYLDSVAPELEAHGVKVTIVHPGFVKSEMTEKNAFPMPFLLEVDDAARRMADAIEKKQPWLQFPTPLVAGMGVVSMLPRGVRRSLLGAGAGKGK